MTRDERIFLLMIQQHKKGAKFLRTNETLCLGSGFGTMAGIPLVYPVFFFFVVATGEGVLSGATSVGSEWLNIGKSQAILIRG